MPENSSLNFETLAIHAGQAPDPATGALMTPIYQTSTYLQDGVGQHRGYEYSRTANPTRSALEGCLAALEGAGFCLATASGMAATDLVLRLLEPGDHVLSGNDVYGGTYRLFEQEFRRYGLQFDYVDTTDQAQVRGGLRANTRMVWLETPSNPLLHVSDISQIAEILEGCSHRPVFVVDNTFATPYLQRPLELGADVVIHSTTKYLGGHSDVIGGAVVTSSPDLHTRLSFLANAAGPVPGPLDCFLVLRGIKTLPVRMDRHVANAEGIVDFLNEHPKVQQVWYPFLHSHPQVEIARRQMRSGGGMISCVLKGGAAAGRTLVEATRLFALAESLGGVESLIELPAAMTHASTADSALRVDQGLVRLSVGLEHADDLVRDLASALDRV